jgi:hypothetical protein
MKDKKLSIRRHNVYFSVLLSTLLIGAMVMPAFAQISNQAVGHLQPVTYHELEQIQDEIEDLNIAIYKIRYQYPDVKYRYTSARGEIPTVEIEGMAQNADKLRLKTSLIELQKLKDRIFNLSNRVGVYYVAETDPEPKEGYKDFYDNLYQHLIFPESAKDHGVEGNIIVKFIVDEEGEVRNVTVKEDINTSFTADLASLRLAASNAVRETSGDWIPAKAGGRPVPHLVALPIEFKIESPLHLSPM